MLTTDRLTIFLFTPLLKEIHLIKQLSVIFTIVTPVNISIGLVETWSSQEAQTHNIISFSSFECSDKLFTLAHQCFSFGKIIRH